MNPKAAPRIASWFDIAIKLTALMMPGLLAIGGWAVTQLMAHESRLDVMEDNRAVWIDRFLTETGEIKQMLRDLDVRVRAIEIAVRKKED